MLAPLALSQTPPDPDATSAPASSPGAGQTPPASPNDTLNPIEDARDRIYYPDDTERLVPLGKKLVANIILDQKEIWTSPFRMHKGDAKWWLGFGAATAALIATDHRTIDTFENSKGQIAWGNRISNVGATYTLIPLVAGFYAYGVWRDEPKPREVGILGTEALLDSLIVVEVLKPIFGRERPDATRERAHFFDGGGSFPSGHAIESWTLASLISHEYHNTIMVPITAYGLATVVSLSRFAAQRHFASDILVGGAMGWFIGRYVYQTHVNHAIHKHAWMHPQIVPEVIPGQGAYAVSLRFSLD